MFGTTWKGSRNPGKAVRSILATCAVAGGMMLRGDACPTTQSRFDSQPVRVVTVSTAWDEFGDPLKSKLSDMTKWYPDAPPSTIIADTWGAGVSINGMPFARKLVRVEGETLPGPWETEERESLVLGITLLGYAGEPPPPQEWVGVMGGVIVTRAQAKMAEDPQHESLGLTVLRDAMKLLPLPIKFPFIRRLIHPASWVSNEGAGHVETATRLVLECGQDHVTADSVATSS
ncbi:MAG: hypothetical protein HYY93_09485 [Planctomycetes bacterium]|nr:hypothetical protein [Planctomycetota bacterium]